MVVLSVTGCGGGGGSKQVTPAAYVNNICASIGVWVSDIQNRSKALSKTLKPGASPTQGKKALKAFISAVTADTDAAVSSAQKAGVPKVNNGKQVASTIVKAFQQAKTVLVRAGSQVDQLPTNSPTAFKAATDKMGTTVQQSLGNIGTSISALKSPELQKAGVRSPACQRLGAL